MRSLAVLSSFVVVAALGVAPSATAAEPGHGAADRRDTPDCVSKKEFRRTPKGTRMRVAQRRFDTRGRGVDGGAGFLIKRYPFCKRARHQADARSFSVFYDSSRRVIRVDLKFCGRTYPHRRPCFR